LATNPEKVEKNTHCTGFIDDKPRKAPQGLDAEASAHKEHGSVEKKTKQ